MLRLTFWTLLVANIAMFAATQTYTDSPKKQDEPRQLQPIEQEKIRLLPSVLILPQAQPTSPATAEQTTEVTTCFEIGEFNKTDVKLFQEKINALLPAGSAEQFHSRSPSGYMVYLPAAQNKKAAEKRISELQKKGIGNYFLITNGNQFRNAISLGIFKNEEAARNLIAELYKLGFDDVELHVKTKQTESTSFLVKNVGRNQMEQLDLILSGFPQASKKECRQTNNFAKEN